MQSSLIGKIEKARKYASEKNRITVESIRVEFAGDHRSHIVELDGGEWRCTCHYFSDYRTCSHVMAMERILSPMIKQVF
ncbi:hypothetical protein FIM12_08450 [SAR202 cluster bacterium AD-804-J14_MRT_500m]|nr:hypothetical protein [SAR202 cluster bacterium AD-804-J14_MRT_500m]